ncbi:hypothetical protein EDD22DRAFT_947353 [Suillus occidentalis]|nr:hypothetical protein EDD22DRAFT_947353 [Suillus occidentalis]
MSSIPPSSFPNVSVYMSQSSLHDSIHTDPNSPEVLKQNVQVALDHVARIQSLAPELTALMQTLRTLAEFLRQTGVGAYPMPPASESQSASSIPPTEQQLVDTTAREVQVLYERLKRIQESNAVAVNLLGAADIVSRAR